MPDTIPDNTSTTATVTVGSTTSGTLETTGDHDWYRISLTAGQAITVTIDGITLEDPYLYIRSSSGSVLYENDDISTGIVRDSRVSFSATTTSWYYIDVGAWNDDYVGTFEVEVTTYTPPPLWTYDQMANQLINGDGEASHFNVTPGGTITVDITGLTAAGQNLARAALVTWSDIIGVTFQEVSNGEQILFTHNEEDAFTESITSGGFISSAHVNVDVQWLQDYGTSLTSYSYQTYIHEIGHALGLSHPGNYNGEARYPYDALFQNDSWAVSVMSYFSQTDNTYVAGLGFNENIVVTPMIADILAMSQLYGLSTTTRAGNTTYGSGWNTSMGALCIFDSGGTDTIDCSGFAGNQLINLNPGNFSNLLGEVGNVSIALGVTIENAIGSTGNDTLLGNDANNVLEGRAGNDQISGGAGSDTLTGEEGSDSLTGGAGTDTFRDTASRLNGDTISDFAGGDKIVFSDANLATFTFSLNGNTLTYSGGSLTFGAAISGTLAASAAAGGGVQLAISTEFDQVITGGSGNDVLVGAGGKDRLIGLGGNDTLTGFAGNDQLEGGDGLDRAIFSGNRANYQFVSIAPGHLQVSGPDGVDQLIDVEQAQFNDGVFATMFFPQQHLASSNFGSGSGWTNASRYPRMLGDINGDGFDDVVGFGEGGIFVSLALGNGSFGGMYFAEPAFGAAGGWTNVDKYPRTLADINGDGFDDVVGFGQAGVFASLALGNGGFGDMYYASSAFGESHGWTSAEKYPRMAADINGDGFDDLIGFGEAGVFVSLALGNGGFGDLFFSRAVFGGAQAWTSADKYPRLAGDINGDGFADLIGFGEAGVFVVPALGNGGFGDTYFALPAFGASQGWTSADTHPRTLADVNGDGLVDLIGFGDAGLYVALANGLGGFKAPTGDIGEFGRSADAGGWSSSNLLPRALGDVNGDGKADLVGFYNDGLHLALNTNLMMI